MSLYSHIQSTSKDRHFLILGFLGYHSWSRKYPSVWKKALFHFTGNKVSVSRNSPSHWINLLIGSSSHKKRRSSSELRSVLLFFLLRYWLQIESHHNFTILFRKKLPECFHTCIERGREIPIKIPCYVSRLWSSHSQCQSIVRKMQTSFRCDSDVIVTRSWFVFLSVWTMPVSSCKLKKSHMMTALRTGSQRNISCFYLEFIWLGSYSSVLKSSW